MPVANRIVWSVGRPKWIVVSPGQRSPGAIPSGIVTPAPGRHPNGIVGTVNILHRRPRPNVDNGTCSAGARVHSHFFRRLDNGFDTIHIGITDDLQHGRAVVSFLQFDHCNVLAFVSRNNCRKNKSVNVSFISVGNPNVVDVAVAIQVEIVHFGIGGIEKLFKFLR